MEPNEHKEHKGNFRYFFANLRTKHRLSLRSEHDQAEVWYMHISPIRAFAGLLAILLLLFIVILSTVAYTPILDYIPGYPGNKSREMLVDNLMRIDSMNHELGSMQIYVDNVALIMDGKTPVVRSVTGTVLDTVKSNVMTPPNDADSILRSQMEGSGPYGLSSTQGGKGGLALTTPVKGVVATHFAPKEGRFGVGVATATDQPVTAVREGAVIFVMWSPNDGHVVQVQHSDNLVSIYKDMGRAMAAVGSRLKAGEVVGYTGDGLSGEGGKRYFEFELWIDGSPVNPETYIVF